MSMVIPSSNEWDIGSMEREWDIGNMEYEWNGISSGNHRKMWVSWDFICIIGIYIYIYHIYIYTHDFDGISVIPLW